MVTHIPTAAYAYFTALPMAEKKFRSLDNNLCDECSGFGYIESVLCKRCEGEGNKLRFQDLLMDLIRCHCLHPTQTIIAEDGMDLFEKVTHLCTECAMVSYFDTSK